MIWILFIISLVVNFILSYTTWNLLRKNEIADDFITSTYASARRTLLDMEGLDVSGAFEADDETGVTFKALQQVIRDYADFVGVETDLDTEE